MTVATIHLGLAWAAGALAAIVAILALLGLRTGSMRRAVTDRLILAIGALVLVNMLVGMSFVAGGELPAGALHGAYAAVALLALPVARTWRGLAVGPSPKLVLIAALVVIVVLVGLNQSG